MDRSLFFGIFVGWRVDYCIVRATYGCSRERVRTVGTILVWITNHLVYYLLVTWSTTFLVFDTMLKWLGHYLTSMHVMALWSLMECTALWWTIPPPL